MARLTALQKARKTIKDLRACLKIQAAENGELFNSVRAAEDRAKNADIEAAAAIKASDGLETKLTTATRRVEILQLELATIRGYTQRIIQSDNAHHTPSVTLRDGQDAQAHLKFGMPEVDPGNVRLGAPSYEDSYYRNR